jgi:hypothetical protein
MNTRTAATDRETLTFPLRLAELAVIVSMLCLLAFFLYHQQTNSGFFTEKFGALEMLALYCPILLSLVSPAIRAWTGHRNPGRPYEIVTSLLLALGSLWLLIAFPFSFVHLADTLPSGLHFILAWVTDDIGKILLLLQIVIGPISAVLTAVRYLSFRRQALRQAY